MKKTTFYITTILILIAANVFSQSNFEKIDEYARNVNYLPTKSLAKELTRNLSTDLEKTRAIFIWITDNIEYDFELSKSTQLQDSLYTSTDEIIKYTLQTRKAICSGYSHLFKNLCDEAGIESVCVDGFSRQYLDFDDKNVPNHSWNAVKIDGTWFLLDTTWASGNGFGNRFEKEFDNYWFLTNPNEFFYSHYPIEQKWTLLNETFTFEKFNELPATISHYLFTQGASIVNPNLGTIEIGTDCKFIFVVEVKNLNIDIELIGYPWQTYATINNLPKPSKEELEKDQTKYDLIIPSLELIRKKVDGNRITYEFLVKHRALSSISLSINGIQSAEYKVIWK